MLHSFFGNHPGGYMIIKINFKVMNTIPDSLKPSLLSRVGSRALRRGRAAVYRIDRAK